MKTFITSLFILLHVIAFAQTGNIRGTVLDNTTKLPINGATVTVLKDTSLTTQTDKQGNFRLEGLPLGRHELSVRYVGYLSVTIPNVEVIAGKDVIADAWLTESYNNIEEVVISTGSSKDRALNEMAATSARQFTVEEVTRYAGGRSDVARLATNFAGVSSPDDSRNDIVVRGNSPTALLWRIEGVPVPSPNHFSTLGTTGSPVSALNSNVMSNSDFITSAFPAEYGNALGAVFDINFRRGNTESYEYMFGIGAMTGIEAMAEGPLGKNGGSFVAAGRYGLLGLVGAGGTTSAVPNYSDLALKLDFGDTKLGRFSLFGIGGRSDVNFIGDEVDEDDLFAAQDEDMFVTSEFGVLGLKNVFSINERSSMQTTIFGTLSGNAVDMNRIFDYGTPNAETLDYTQVDNREMRYGISSVYTKKVNNRLSFKKGMLFELYQLDFDLATRAQQADNDADGYPDYNTLINNDGNFFIFQPYLQGQYRLSEFLTLNAGLHGQFFSLNKEFVLEPRASLSWQVANGHRIHVGYGMHHQNAPVPLLFLTGNVNGELVQTNRDLDLVRSQHYVLGYDIRLGNDWRAKIEAYYQSIDRAAIDPFSSSYSSLTEGADFEFSIDKFNLVSEGTGNNKGIELTLEKFFSRGYYMLLTTSLFDARYTGSDGVERDSPFNNKYVVNILGGREFKLGKSGRNSLFFDSKLSTAGGRHYTHVDLEASSAAGYEILQENLAFSEQYDQYFRLDFKFGINVNSKKRKLSHRFYLDLQNVTGNRNVFVRQYNRLTNQVDQIDQIGFFPDFGYRIQF